MSSIFSERQQTLFFSRQLGWVEQPTADTELRLDCSLRAQSQAVVTNTLYRTNPDGGFEPLASGEIVDLPASQQGMVFTCSPHLVGSDAYLMVRPVRYLDETALPLLDGLRVFSLDGNMVDDPQLAADCFLLEAEAAPVFYERAQAAGGVVLSQQGDLQAMYRHLEQLGDIAAKLTGICQQSQASIDQIAQGINGDFQAISDRSKQAHMLRTKSGELLSRIREQAELLTSNSTDIELAAHADSYLENAEQWAEHITLLHREHRSYEIQARARLKEGIGPQLAVPEIPAAQRRVMLLPLVEYYTQQGFDARLVRDGAVLALGDIVVELTSQPSARTPHTEQVAAELTGRQTAERTQREL